MQPLFVARHRMLLKVISAGPLYFAFMGHSWAGLTWEKDKIELNPEIGEEVVRTAYSFTNTGTTPISILAIKSSNSCVSTNLERLEYAPGETGTIKVTFDQNMDKATPDQGRTIKVVTSDAPNTPKTLELKVNIREAVKVSPEALVWRHGRPGKPKEVIITAGSGVEDLQLIQTAHNDNFSLEMKPVVEGHSYRLKITPQNTDTRCIASLVFDVKSPSIRRRADCEIALRVD